MKNQMNKFSSLALILASTAIFVGCATTATPTATELRAPFIDNKSQIEACYEKVLKKQPDVGAGTTELKFLINEEGRAYKTIFLKKKSTLQSKLLNACIKRVVSSWQFPKGKKIEVVYPFQFETAKSAAASATPTETPVSDESKVGEPEKNDTLDIINTNPEESGDEMPETPAE
jgi:hypothetical protein